jgi:DNA polymerase III delta prime subunit
MSAFDEIKVISLNEAQNKALTNIKKYLANPNKHNFLLLGPAGSGKTTVIVNAFNDSNLKICFCAFTNKATQVLKNIAKKFSINFQADFMTIHKLLGLEIKYLDSEHEIAFTFDKNKVIGLAQYDVIIFDECSTISADLYKYICEAWDFIDFKCNRKLKLLFLGDFWQLPPVGEKKSVIFATAIENKWQVSKLDKVMRSANDDLRSINENMLEWIPLFKAGDVDDFVKSYPYNLVPKTRGRYLGLDALLDKYLDTWQSNTSDTVILTYSRSNCEKTNFAIQDRLDLAADREIPAIRELTKFYAGDRCCIDKPIEVHIVKEKTEKLSASKLDFSDFDMDQMLESTLPKQATKVTVIVNEPPETKDEPTNTLTDMNDLKTVYLDEATGESLYNGEIFDVISAVDVNIVTPLNRFQYMPKVFAGQLLTIRRIADTDKSYEILHIPEKTLKSACIKIRAKERRMFYLNIMSDFVKKYPKLDYGYCITVYKSQGSEWDTVFVNLNSIKWSVVGQTTIADIEKKSGLFKTTYTALSRASNKLFCLWSR